FWLRRAPDVMLAVWAERRFPALRERLLTAVEIGAGLQSGASPALAAGVADEAAGLAAQLDLPRAVPTTGLRTPSAFAALAVLALVGHMAVAPDSFRTWLQRVLAPHADIPVWATTRVHMEPGDAVIPRGDSVRVSAIASGGVPRLARLFLRTPTGRWSERELKRATDVPGGARFDLALPAVQEDLSYYARVHDGKSNTYRIRVEDRPVVKGATVSITYPAYMARPPTTREGSGADILAPVGSVAEIRIAANKDLKTVVATDAAGGRANWQVDRADAVGRVRLMRDGALTLSLTDERGFTSRPDPKYLLRTIPDRPPSARILKPTGDLERSPLGSIRIDSAASDDYGVGSMALVHRSQRHVRSSAIMSRPAPDARAVRAACVLNLAPLNLREGDLVTYRVEARDRDDVTGPHVGRSPEYRIRIVSAAEMRERSDADVTREVEALRKLVAQQRRIEARIRQAQSDPSSAQAAASEQRSVAAQTAQLRSQVEAATERMRDNGIASDAEMGRRSELGRALDQLAARTMPRAAASMQAAAQPAGDRTAAVEQASRQAGEVRSELERLAAATGPPASRDEIAREAARIAREQAELADKASARADTQEATGRPPSDLAALASQQADLRDRTETLANRLASAAAASADDRAMRESARDFARQGVPGKQEAARRQLASGRPSDAADLQRDSAAALQQLASNLMAGRDPSASPADIEKQAQALGKASDQLNDLANRQRGVQQATERNLSKDEAAASATQEREIQSALGKVMPALQPAPAADESARRAGAAMSRAAESLSQNNPTQASQPARQATRDLLQAAMEAREAARLLEAQAAAMQSQREFEALAREQRALQGKTQASQQAAGKDEKAVREKSEALAREQDQLVNRALRGVNEIDSATPKWMGWQATRRMEEARAGLWRHDMGSATRRYQGNAAQTLDRLAAALQQQATSASMQVEAGMRGSPEHQFADVSGDVRAVREMQAQIRSETSQMEDRRAGRPERALTDQERREAASLAGAEGEAQSRLREASDRMGDAIGEAAALRSTMERMTPVREALQRADTGQGNQERQSAIIAALDKALERNRDELASSMRRSSQNANAQDQRRRASSNTPGQRDAPVVQSQTPMFRIPDAARFRFGGMSAREQQLMQHGKLEKVPPEYRDLVSRYYRALSERR
ncbi:MAG: DUF4175 family protein, partial [Armatimonadetes bacterium]|nr:DUF4175 family protein [Armatimonadota bacterium]